MERFGLCAASKRRDRAALRQGIGDRRWILAVFDTDGADADKFRNGSGRSVETRKLFAAVTGRKVFLRSAGSRDRAARHGGRRSRGRPPKRTTPPEHPPRDLYRIAFRREFDGGSVAGELYLNDKNVFNIARIFGVEAGDSAATNSIASAGSFTRRKQAPKTFHELLTALPDSLSNCS
jgi:hypothetical protein